MARLRDDTANAVAARSPQGADGTDREDLTEDHTDNCSIQGMKDRSLSTWRRAGGTLEECKPQQSSRREGETNKSSGGPHESEGGMCHF